MESQVTKVDFDGDHTNLIVNDIMNGSSAGMYESDDWDSEYQWEYHENDELEAHMLDKERLQFIDEMINAHQTAENWDNHTYLQNWEKFTKYFKGLAELTLNDIDDIQAFKLHMVSNMPQAAFNQMRFAFRHKLSISSLYAITHKIAILSGITPKWIDCCINSCVAFSKTYDKLTECPHCKESWYLTNSTHPRRMFCYIPLIPCLQKLFANPDVSKELLCQHNYIHTSGIISNVFDGTHYKRLCKMKVMIDGRPLLPQTNMISPF